MDTKFLDFKWGDKKLSDFNGEIIREGDLEFFNTPEFSNEIVYPKLGDSSIFLGTQKEGLVLEFTVLLESITLVKYNEFLGWLSIDKKADKLYLDYSSNRYRNVKVNSISRGRLFNANDCGNETLYDIEVDISFITVGDWAIITETEKKLTSNNSTYACKNNGSLPMHFDIRMGGAGTVWGGIGTVWTSDDVIIINNDIAPLVWDTATGIVYKNSNKNSFFVGSITYNKTLFLEPGESLTFKKNSEEEVTIVTKQRDYI